MPAGRPKGQPRTGGRKKGTPNKATADIRAVAQFHGAQAIEVLAEIMNGTKFPPAARVAASREILDRGYGKAPQPFVANTANFAEIFGELIDKLPG